MSIIDQSMCARIKIVPIATVVIPSVFHSQLVWFLQKNAGYIRDHLVIIVSSDLTTTQNTLDAFMPNVTLVQIEKPLGFAKTVNLGLESATTEWVATCNDDVELSEQWLENLIAAADKNIGGINPVILAPDLTIESAGIGLLPIGKAQPLTVNIPTAPFQTEALNAACVVYRRTALEAVGFFDEIFGSYLEDIDLSLSLVEAGWQQLVVPSVTVMHQRHQTSQKILGKKKAYYDLRNWWILLFKHWSWRLWLQYWPGILLERARNLSGMIKALLSN